MNTHHLTLPQLKVSYLLSFNWPSYRGKTRVYCVIGSLKYKFPSVTESEIPAVQRRGPSPVYPREGNAAKAGTSTFSRSLAPCLVKTPLFFRSFFPVKAFPVRSLERSAGC